MKLPALAVCCVILIGSTQRLSENLEDPWAVHVKSETNACNNNLWASQTNNSPIGLLIYIAMLRFQPTLPTNHEVMVGLLCFKFLLHAKKWANPNFGWKKLFLSDHPPNSGGKLTVMPDWIWTPPCGHCYWEVDHPNLFQLLSFRCLVNLG